MGRTKGFEVYEGMPDHPAATEAAFAEENGAHDPHRPG